MSGLDNRQVSAALVAVLAIGATISARADIAPRSWTGVPAQIIPQAAETGAPSFTTPSGGSTFFGDTNTGGDNSSGDTGGDGSSGGGSTTVGSGASYDTMMAQSYGQTALNTAQQLGINPNAIAGIGQLESNFQNVGTANGSSSATGPWQITSGTWNGYIAKYNLPYTASDITNPNAQAVVANYILKDYASSVSSAIGQPATVQQAYGAYVFGPTGGSGLASASSTAPMSDYVSAQALANNNMTGWTVGQFYNRVSSKIGSVATQTVTS